MTGAVESLGASGGIESAGVGSARRAVLAWALSTTLCFVYVYKHNWGVVRVVWLSSAVRGEHGRNVARVNDRLQGKSRGCINVSESCLVDRH
jgi:hypothetical protein